MMIVAGAASTTGLVMKPLNEAFGWSRAQVAASVFIVAILGLVMAPVAGNAIRVRGARFVALSALPAFGLSLSAVALSGPNAWTWFAAWALVGISMAPLGPILWSSTISALFDRSRGVALSIALCGGGLAYAVWPPLVEPILTTLGWRGVYGLFAALAVLALMPLAYLALPTMQPAQQPLQKNAVVVPSHIGPALGEAMLTARFWKLVVALVLMAGSNGSLALHFFPILSERGIGPAEAAFLTACLGPAIIVGRLAMGVLADRFFAPLVTAGAVVLPIITCLVLLFAGADIPLIVVAAVALGLSSGSAGSAVAYLVGRYFGLRHYASIYGIMIAVYGVSYGLIPTISGHVFDVAGSYRPLFPVFIALLVPASLLIGSLGPYRDRDASS